VTIFRFAAMARDFHPARAVVRPARRTAFPVIVLVLSFLLIPAVPGCNKGEQTSGKGKYAKPGEKSSGSSRPELEVRAGVDKAIATTGDKITYTVEVDYKKGLKVTIPEVGAEIAGLRVVDSETPKQKDLGDRILEKRIYYLRADLVGSYVLPQVEVKYREKSGAKEKSATTSKIFIEVKSVLPKDGSAKDIRDIKPISRPDYGMSPYLWIGGGLVALVLMAAIALGIGLKRRKSKENIMPLPHEAAYSALEKLRRMNLDDPKEIRLFYFELSGILRAYIEARFGLNATDLTSQEILARIKYYPGLGNEERVLLRSFLLGTDEVKFAGKMPSEKDIEENYEEALQVIQRTTVEQVAEETNDDSSRSAA